MSFNYQGIEHNIELVSHFTRLDLENINNLRNKLWTECRTCKGQIFCKVRNFSALSCVIEHVTCWSWQHWCEVQQPVMSTWNKSYLRSNVQEALSHFIFTTIRYLFWCSIFLWSIALLINDWKIFIWIFPLAQYIGLLIPVLFSSETKVVWAYYLILIRLARRRLCLFPPWTHIRVWALMCV